MRARFPIVCLSLATILFVWLTMRTSVDLVDGPLLQYYGFPLPYRRWSQFSSLHYDLDLAAMAVDYVVYVTCSTLPLALRGVRARIQAAPRWAVAGLAGVATISALLSSGGGVESYHAVRFSSDLVVTGRALHLGPYYPY